MAKRVSGAMHVARVRKTIKGKTYESALLRQSYRQGQQVKHRTLASLTALPPHVVDAIEGMLKGESWVPVGDALIIQRSWEAPGGWSWSPCWTLNPVASGTWCWR